MTEKSVGDLLREARVKKGIELGELEATTGIPTHHLLALELDQFALIPEGSVDDYLSRYSESVGLDIAYINSKREVQDAFQQTISVATSSSKYNIQPAFAEDTRDEEVRTEHRRSRSHREPSQKKNPWAAILLSLIALSIVVLVGYFVWQAIPFDKLGSSTKPKEAPVAETTTSVETTTVAPVATSLTNQMVEGQLTTTAVTSKEEVELLITLTGAESWVSVSNDIVGERGTILNAEQKELRVNLRKGSSSFVTLGISQGVEVFVDGEKVDLADIINNSPGSLTLKVE